ncbi:MAG TPA: ribonuclease III [Patescibacteria group bacterium]|nr:ribonuclease III [Patescibacteria group bacterium]
MKNLPKINNQELFEQAFTHRSYLNEAKKELESNERLEFLGDSILSFVVSEHLYNHFQKFDEGILTNLRSLLVNTKSIAQAAKTLGFGNYLKLSKGEEESKGRENESLLANSFEAFLGALYLDQGIQKAREFVAEMLFPQIEEIVSKKAFKDPKSLLQEYVQARKQNSPIYKVLHEEGPPHAKTFTIGVFVNATQIGEGIGRSKQEAEEQAAQKGLEFLQSQNPQEMH